MAVSPKTGKAKQAAQHGARKAVETSTVLPPAFIAAMAAIAPMFGVAPGDVTGAFEAMGAGNWAALAASVGAVALTLAPRVLRYFGWTRTADAFTAARAPDSPGGKDVTVGEIVGIGEAATIDAGMREARGDQRGDDD